MPILYLIAGMILLDQGVKFYVQQTMQLGESIPVITNVFHITYILNAGAAFGILENQRWFFILIAVVLCGAMGFFYKKIVCEGRVMQLGTGLLVGGAIGNVIDRADTGLVVDYLDFRIWPIFNIADIGIVCGVALIVYYMLFQLKSGEQESEELHDK